MPSEGKLSSFGHGCWVCLSSVFYYVILCFKNIGLCVCSFCHYGGDPDDNSEALPPWRILWTEFVNRTTWHGLKYLELRSRFLLRKLIWSVIMLTNFCIFLYITYTKAVQLNSYSTSLGLSISHLATLPFPAVTLCNNNKYKMSALQKNNLFDLLAIDTEKDANCEYCSEYLLFSQIQSIPFKDPPYEVFQFSEINRHVCMRLCSTVYESLCSAFLYYRSTRICTLTSYTGEFVDTVVENSSIPNIEFYRRKRSLVNRVSSNFEYDNPFVSTLKNAKEIWQPVAASSLRIRKDNTLALGLGHVMSMPTETGRKGYMAELISPYLNISNLCFTFSYWIDVPSPQQASSTPSITVYMEDEELIKTVVLVENSILEDWKTVSIRLPLNGVYRFKILGKRGDNGLNGISIDDVSILDCSHLRNNCLVSFFGSGYLGNISHDSENRKCEPWISAGSDTLLLKFQEVGDVNTSYCRFIDGEGWKAPSCFVKGFDGILTLSECSIPYCDSEANSNETFRCRSNGFNIPKGLKCDGKKDCMDGSDEIDDCASNITCVFSDGYICGYRQDETQLRWLKSPVSDLSYYQDTVLSRDMSKMADVLALFSSTSNLGDKAYLVSPLDKFLKPTKILISSMLKSSVPDNIPNLYIYLLSTFYSPIKILAEVSLKSSGFVTTAVCVPPGTYALALIGVCNFAYDQFVALAYVEKTTEECVVPNLIESYSFNCSFTTLCGYTVYSTSARYKYTLTFEDEINDKVSNSLVCGNVYKSQNGYITTPNYPFPYPPNLNCSFAISVPADSTIELIFENFHLEPQIDCLYDYLEIYTTKNNRSQRLCGDDALPLIKFNETLLRFTFITDGSNSFSGFKLSYKIVNNEGVKHTLSFTNSNFSTASNLNHINLYSPPINLFSNSCLSVRLKTNSHFTIQILREKNQKEYYSNKTMIFEATLSPGPIWNWYNITMRKDHLVSTNVVVMYEFFGSNVNPELASISDVILLEGTCRNKYTFGTLSCDFSDADQCGYLDISDGPTYWVRSYEVESKSYSMRANFNSSGINEAILQSVHIFKNTLSCVTIHYLTSAPDFIITLWPNLQQTKTNFFLVSGRGKIHHSLPNLSFNLHIYARLTKSQGHYIKIYDVSVADGVCNDKENLSPKNLDCDFTSCEKCDLNYLGPEGAPWSCASLDYIFKRDIHFVNASQNITGKAMIYNMTNNDQHQKGIFFTPFSLIDTSTVLKFRGMSSVSGPNLDVYMTSSLGLISNRLASFTFNESYVWHNFAVCLPLAYTRIAFVASLPSGYVLINNMETVSINCEPPKKTDCNATDSLNCDKNYHIWTTGYKWLVTNTNGRNIQPGASCFQIFNQIEGTWTFDEINAKSKDGNVLCEIYIVGNSKINVELKFEIFAFSNCSEQYIEIWYRSDNGASPSKNILCSGIKSNDAINFTTFETLQIRILSSINVTPKIQISYRYIPYSYEGFSLGLYNGGVKSKGMASWISPLYTTMSKFVCLNFRTDDNNANINGYILTQNSSSPSLIFSKLRSTQNYDWLVSQLNIKIDQSLGSNNTFQIKLNFDWPVLDNTNYKIIVSLREINIEMNECQKAVKLLSNLSCNSKSVKCNYFDSSMSTTRWYLVDEIISDNLNNDDCSTGITESSYHGNISITLSNRICQSWDTQNPHQHIQYTDINFSNSTVAEIQNRCRNPMNPYLPRTPWCYTTDPIVRREFCNVPRCSKKYYVVDFFAKQILTSTLLSPTFSALNQEGCYSLSYLVNSSSLVFSINSLLKNGDKRELTNESGLISLTVGHWNSVKVTVLRDAVQLYLEVKKRDITYEPVQIRLSDMTFEVGACPKPLATKSSNAQQQRVPYTGPRLPRTQYFSYVYHDLKDKTMADLTPMLSHSFDNLVHNCSFSNKPCALNSELTNMGNCVKLEMTSDNIVTFPGPSFGARIVLNIEQYEHIRPFVQGVGVKMQAWMPGNVQLIDDMGISIRPGIFNQALLTYSQASFMSPPYGTCGTVPLANYPSNEPYTEEKCRLNYRTDQSLQDCHCRREYLPGTSEICNLEQFVNCTNVKTDKSILESNCLAACLYDVFNIQVSGSNLSPLTLPTILGTKINQVQKNLASAMEIRHRILPEIMSDLIYRLQSYINYLSYLNDYILYKIADPATSALHLLEEKINTHWSKNYIIISDLATRMLAEAEVSAEGDYMPNYVAESVNRVVVSMEMILASGNGSIEYYNALSTNLQSLVTNLDLWNAARPVLSCSNATSKTKDSSRRLLSLLTKNATSSKEIVEQINAMISGMRILKSCEKKLSESADSLKTFLTYLDSRKYLRNYTLHITVYNLLLEMQAEQDDVSQLLSDYCANIITKEMLAYELINSLQKTSNWIRTTVQLLITSVINPLFTKILDARLDAAYLSETLTNKFNEDNSTNTAVYTSIKADIIDLEFRWHVHDLKEFKNIEANLEKFVKEINAQMNGLDQLANNLIKNMTDYLNLLLIDQNFIESNFLLLDIYFGQMTFNNFSTSTTYTWINFASEMGGYMNLLMGCSLLTMCEVVDLIIYHSVVKIYELFEGRKSKRKRTVIEIPLPPKNLNDDPTSGNTRLKYL